MTTPGTVALYVAIVLAIIPATLVYLAIEPVTTMMIPVGAAMLPLLARSWEGAVAMRAAGLSILGVFTVLGMASVGTMFLPAVAAMAVSLAQLGGARPRHRQ